VKGRLKTFAPLSKTLPMETLRRVASFLFVGALWGCSNAFIKQTTALSPSSGLEYDKATVRPGEWGVKMGLASLVRRKVNERGDMKGIVPLSLMIHV
jgi:hypothetical protein